MLVFKANKITYYICAVYSTNNSAGTLVRIKHEPPERIMMLFTKKYVEYIIRFNID